MYLAEDFDMSILIDCGFMIYDVLSIDDFVASRIAWICAFGESTLMISGDEFMISRVTASVL